MPGTGPAWVDGRPLPGTPLDHGGETTSVHTLHLDGEPTVVTAGVDSTIQLTGPGTGHRLGVIDDAPSRGIAVGLLAGRPAAAVCRMFGPFTVWDLATRTETATPAAANVRIGEAARGWIDAGDGPTVVTVHESRVRTHHLLTGAVAHLRPDHDEPVTALATTDDPAHPAAVAIARTDGSVTVVDGATHRTVSRVTLPHPATALAWTPDGHLVIACRRVLLRADVTAEPASPGGVAAR